MTGRTAAARALGAGLLLALTVAAVALGYAGQVAATVAVSGPGAQQSCGIKVPVSALIQDSASSPISGQPVSWSLGTGKVAGDQITPASSTTNASGIATASVIFACTPHKVQVLAAADEVSGSVLVATTGKGLPRTDVALESGTSPLAMLLAALAVLVGSGVMVRRFAARR